MICPTNETGEPVQTLSLGAGVQSSTLALLAAKGIVGPMPKLAFFADTHDEPQSVYRWLAWLERELPYPVERVSKGKLSDDVLLMRRTADGRLYSRTNVPFFTKNDDGVLGKIRMRSCTADFKIRPIIRATRQLVGRDAMSVWRRDHKDALTAMRIAKKEKKPRPLWAWRECQADPLVVQWIGISTDEVKRIKPSRDPWILCRWPLIELRWSRQRCLMWMREQGYPEPPRSACIYCPYHDNDAWRRMKLNEPDEFAAAVQFERDIQAAKFNSSNFSATPFLHRSCKPLDEVDFRNDADRGQLSLFDEECEGMCGV